MLPMYYYSSFRVVDLYIARQKVQFFSLGAFTVQIGSKRRICRFVWYLSGLLYLRNCIGEVVWNIFGAVFFFTLREWNARIAIGIGENFGLLLVPFG